MPEAVLLTDLQTMVLDEIHPSEVAGTVTLVHRLNLPYSQVLTVLYTLQDLGLIRRIPFFGWERVG